MADDNDDNNNDRPKPTPRLTREDARRVWELRRRGFVQHAIAARFGVNQGRISEILTGKTFPGSGAGGDAG